MEQGMPLLRPMQPGSLNRKPAPQAHYEPNNQPLPLKPVLRDPETLRAPVLVQERLPVEPMPFVPPVEDDEDDALPDAMPTSQMPQPVSVPLFDMDEPVKKRGRVWLWLLAALSCVLAAAGGVYLRMIMG